MGGRYFHQCRKSSTGTVLVGKWWPNWRNGQGKRCGLLPSSCGQKTWNLWTWQTDRQTDRQSGCVWCRCDINSTSAEMVLLLSNWSGDCHRRDRIGNLSHKTQVSFLRFKPSPCSECYIPSFWWFPSIWILYADVSEHFVYPTFWNALSHVLERSVCPTFRNALSQVLEHCPFHVSERSVPRFGTLCLFHVSECSVCPTFQNALSVSCFGMLCPMFRNSLSVPRFRTLSVPRFGTLCLFHISECSVCPTFQNALSHVSECSVPRLGTLCLFHVSEHCLSHVLERSVPRFGTHCLFHI